METTTYKLKDVLKIGNGKDHSSLPDGEYPVLGSGGIMRYANRYLYDGESVLLPRKGTLNNIQYIKGKFWTVDTCYYTIINQDITHPYYLYRLLRTFDLSGLDSGASIPSMTSKTYYGIKVQLPPLPTQQKIASILSAYDNLIQNFKKQIEALQTAASELYKEWFVRFRFPGYQTTKFENGIPEGWKVEKIGEYCNIRIGGDVPEENSETKDEKHKYPIFSNGINEDGLYGFADTFKISEPSVTISARGTVGFVCLRREPYYPIVRLICLIPRKDLGVFYLYHSLEYADLDGNGTSQQQLTAPMVSKRKIVIAEENLIEKFNLNAKIIYNKIDLLKIQITNLTQQRDLLLPRLMSGKLEV